MKSDKTGPSPPLANARGFTLLEVVVAAALLGIGVAVAMQVFSGGVRNMYKIERAHKAMAHAENVMNEVLANEEIRQPYSDSGDLDEDFFYEVRVDYWDDPEAGEGLPEEGSPAPRVYLLGVTVEIHFKDSERGRMYRISSLKTVAEETEATTGGDALRRLFGRRPGQ